MLLAPIQPVYPAMAKATRTEGVVVMEATISKTGRIESLRAVSGPAILRGAAMDAVQAARYAPYQLNGEATEVQTTITVVFRLGS
jgi:protein TonB